MSRVQPGARHPAPSPRADRGARRHRGLPVGHRRAPLALLHLDADGPGPHPRPGAPRARRHAARPGPSRPRRATRRPTPPGSSRSARSTAAGRPSSTRSGCSPSSARSGSAASRSLLMTSVLACSVNRAPHLWKLTVHPRTTHERGASSQHAPLSFATTGPGRAGHASPRWSRRPSGRAASGRSSRPTATTVHIYADHNRWGPFGTVIAHLSLVVILVGALLGATFGFRDEGVAVAGRLHRRDRRRDRPVGRGDDASPTPTTPTAARATTPATSSSTGTASRSARPTVRVNEPLRVGDMTFYQSYFGAAAAMRDRRSGRRVLYDQGVPAGVVGRRRPPRGRPDRPAGCRPDRLRHRAGLRRGRPRDQARADAGRGLRDRQRGQPRSRPRS